MTIWYHFFYEKYTVVEQKMAAADPDVVNRYWWKRLTPPLEFGAMHAGLLQMALIPLTMCRHTLANLATTMAADFIPFKAITGMHIWLGYTLCIVIFASSIFFFTFFGMLCEEQKQGFEPQVLNKDGVLVNSFCDKFTSEMMLTG
eukprot:GSChrysophyteH1.ASY1.ANO1.1241.1 assembled CDS